MKHKITILILSAIFSLEAQFVVNASQVTTYANYIYENTFEIIEQNNVKKTFKTVEEKNAYLQNLLNTTYKENKFSDKDYSIKKGMILFFLSIKNLDKDENLSKIAYEYWDETYKLKEYQNPFHKAYLGCVEALYGGALQTPQPIKKVTLAVNGMKKISEAIEEYKSSKDNLGIGYLYFLKGSVEAGLPSFFKEFKFAPDSLKTALKYYSMSSKENIYDNQISLWLVSYVYFTFGDYSLVESSVSKAKKYFQTGLKYLDTIQFYSSLRSEFEIKLKTLN